MKKDITDLIEAFAAVYMDNGEISEYTVLGVLPNVQSWAKITVN